MTPSFRIKVSPGPKVAPSDRIRRGAYETTVSALIAKAPQPSPTPPRPPLPPPPTKRHKFSPAFIGFAVSIILVFGGYGLLTGNISNFFPQREFVPGRTGRAGHGFHHQTRPRRVRFRFFIAKDLIMTNRPVSGSVGTELFVINKATGRILPAMVEVTSRGSSRDYAVLSVEPIKSIIPGVSFSGPGLAATFWSISPRFPGGTPSSRFPVPIARCATWAPPTAPRLKAGPSAAPPLKGRRRSDLRQGPAVLRLVKPARR